MRVPCSTAFKHFFLPWCIRRLVSDVPLAQPQLHLQSLGPVCSWRLGCDVGHRSHCPTHSLSVKYGNEKDLVNLSALNTVMLSTGSQALTLQSNCEPVFYALLKA